MVNNYFRIGTEVVTFDDTTLASTSAAYEALTNTTPGAVVVYKMPSHSGPWQSAGLVGHRARADILQDIKLSKVTHAAAGDDRILLAGAAELLMFSRNELAARDSASGHASMN